MPNVFETIDKNYGQRGEELPVKNTGNPDSETLNGLCSRCANQSSFDLINTIPISFGGTYYSTGYFDELEPERSYIDQVAILECRHCNQRTVVIEERCIDGKPDRVTEAKGGIVSFKGMFWWPLSELNLSLDIPLEICAVYQEGVQALAAKCPRASVVMFRRTLEAIAVDKGIQEGTLYKRMEKLFSLGLVAPTFKDWFKEIRLIGNSGAHYDVIDDVNESDAVEMRDFIREALRHIYEIPKSLERRRKK